MLLRASVSAQNARFQGEVRKHIIMIAAAEITENYDYEVNNSLTYRSRKSIGSTEQNFSLTVLKAKER